MAEMNTLPKTLEVCLAEKRETLTIMSQKPTKQEFGTMYNKINMPLILLIITILTTGLLAGLFYGYSCSVIGGLGNLPDIQYLEAFQSIDRAIQNPVFLFSFMGNVFLLPVVAIIMNKSGAVVSFQFLLIATLVYVIGVLGITIFCNIPLNEQLARFQIANADADEISAMRKAFEKPWNYFHSIRTIAAIISFSFSILAITKFKI